MSFRKEFTFWKDSKVLKFWPSSYWSTKLLIHKFSLWNFFFFLFTTSLKIVASNNQYVLANVKLGLIEMFFCSYSSKTELTFFCCYFAIPLILKLLVLCALFVIILSSSLTLTKFKIIFLGLNLYNTLGPTVKSYHRLFVLFVFLGPQLS